MSADPRINHPPRVSDLYGDARRAVLFARHDAARDRHMATYTGEPTVGEPLWRSIVAGLLLAVAFVAMVLAGAWL